MVLLLEGVQEIKYLVRGGKNISMAVLQTLQRQD
jgi:hypothetical protein